MNKKLQVFTSSTYLDMQPERQAAVEAILRAGHIPAGMELFAAGDKSQLDTIRKWIDDSDVFMLILGGRYGSIEPTTGKSYIELEYDYATSQKKPLFAAVISQAYLDEKVRNNGLSAIEQTNGLLLQEFRNKVTSKICRFFNDTNELKVIVFESLANAASDSTLAGWVRGSDVVNPKAALDEIGRLRAEVAALTSRNEAIEMINAHLRTSTVSPSASAAPAVSEDAKLLAVTAKNGDGYIHYIRMLGGAIIQAAGRNFITPQNDREEARWKSAIDELRAVGLVEVVGSKGEAFRLTKRGYEFADQLDG